MNTTTKFKPRKPSKKIKATTHGGKPVTIRVHKGVPKGCSVPRQICIKCLKTKIEKRSKLYDGKVCAACLEEK